VNPEGSPIIVIVLGTPRQWVGTPGYRISPDRRRLSLRKVVASAPTAAEPMTRTPADRNQDGQAVRWSDLTERELAVASLVGRGLTNQQIARRLTISPHTVNFHLRQVFRKLNIHSRVDLAVLACAYEGTHGPAGGTRQPFT